MTNSVNFTFKILSFLAKCNCLFPIGTQENVKWYSWKYFPSYFMLFMSLVKIGSFSIYSVQNEFNIAATGPIVGNMFVIASIVTFTTALHKKWLQFTIHFQPIEKHRNNHQELKQTRKIKIILWIYLCSTIIYMSSILGRELGDYNSLGNKNGLETFSKNHHFFIYAYLPYNTAFGVLGVIQAGINASIWFFVDCVLIILTQMITSNFKTFNKHLFRRILQKTTETKINSSPTSKNIYQTLYFRNLRKNYIKLSEQCLELNRNISNIVLASYLANSTYCVIQLYLSGKFFADSKDDLAKRIYFTYSFAAVIIRMLCLTFSIASVNEESKKTFDVLVALPSHLFDEEVNRWLDYISSDLTKITASRFFDIKRGVILSVLQAIATYEVVLVQHSPDAK